MKYCFRVEYQFLVLYLVIVLQTTQLAQHFLVAVACRVSLVLSSLQVKNTSVNDIRFGSCESCLLVQELTSCGMSHEAQQPEYQRDGEREEGKTKRRIYSRH